MVVERVTTLGAAINEVAEGQKVLVKRHGSWVWLVRWNRGDAYPEINEEARAVMDLQPTAEVTIMDMPDIERARGRVRGMLR